MACELASADSDARTAKLYGSVSIDMDTLRDYAGGYGFEYRRTPDPVYADGLPRFLDLLAKHGVSATIFVIGRDAAVPEHADVLRRAAAQGHELANHTMTHPRHLSGLPDDALESEIRQADALITDLRGQPLNGLRSPCYDVSSRVLRVLRKLGYLYDSSVHPTLLAPLVDLAVLIKSRFRTREARPGTYAHVLAPVRPYRPSPHCYWRRGSNGSLLELPLSTVPWCRLPFYGTFAQATGMRLFRASLACLRWRRWPLNFHYHAVELVDLTDPGVDMRFRVHPGLAKPVSQKREEIDEALARFTQRYELITLEEMARRSLGSMP